ncbi:MAG: NAD(P)/FAD-dependent oxidoreductase [Clostridia bacterium]|nr:NAD(P)/FAD-dependent oxidoreductase [Clostridia bacterium]
MLESEVAIIGSGIVGSFIFNTLTLKGVKCILIEKGEDVSLGATKANSGIIHAGYDCTENTLKAKFNVEGNKMYEEIASRLGEKIVNCGSLVVGDENSLEKLTSLLNRGLKNGVKNLEILNKQELHKLEPNLSDKIHFGLYAKDAKIISPYHFCISLVEEALINGGVLKLNYNTTNIKYSNNQFVLTNDIEEIKANYLINACAEGVNTINNLLNEPLVDIRFTKGEYMLLDNSEKGLVSRPIFPLPTEKGKGILVCPTVQKNIFLGPTAVDVKEYETSVNYESLSTIKAQVVENVDNINFKKVIKLYAGVRVKTNDDFYIEFSKTKPNYLVISGICSPGLSAAPAIAKYVLERLVDKGLKTKTITLKKRKPYTNILSLSYEELNALVKKDSNYGEVVCRCEVITKGEILEVLNGPIKNLTTDGIKRRLRTTMGRCQGSFCYPKLLKIVSNFYNKHEKEINFKGKSSLIVSDIKEGGLYENK